MFGYEGTCINMYIYLLYVVCDLFDQKKNEQKMSENNKCYQVLLFLMISN